MAANLLAINSGSTNPSTLLKELTEPYRACNKCAELKPISDFTKASRLPSGYLSHCKACDRIYKQARRDANRDAYRLKKQKYVEANREVVRAAKKRWEEANIEEVRRIKREWNRKNNDKTAAATRRFRKANPEKVKLLNYKRRNAEGSFTAADIQRLDSTCVCGVEATTIDHIEAVATGGTNYPENLQLLCQSCNSQKGTRNHHEYLEWLIANDLKKAIIYYGERYEEVLQVQDRKAA